MDELLNSKKQEVEALYATLPQRKKGVFEQTIATPGLSVIAEVKRQSPSSGVIDGNLNPLELVHSYLAGGAATISVLTDRTGFGGSLQDLKTVRKNFPEAVILRKEFVIDPLQVRETAELGANALLLMVSVLGNKIKEYLHLCEAYGLEALVEVHNEEEIDIALNAGAKIIGVNNRNLHTFQTDLNTAKRLASLIPNTVLKVAESGMRTPEDALSMLSYGYDGVLIGEGLVRSPSAQDFLERIHNAC